MITGYSKLDKEIQQLLHKLIHYLNLLKEKIKAKSKE